MLHMFFVCVCTGLSFLARAAKLLGIDVHARGPGALRLVGCGAPDGARAMGACCRRQSANHDGADKPWKLYADREEEWNAPSTTAQRDRRWRPSTVSLSSGELERYTQDESMPRRAQHAADELSRRARARG